MKRISPIVCFVFILLCFWPAKLIGQSNIDEISFGYDNNGNRTSRTIKLKQIQQGALSFPLENYVENSDKSNSDSKVENARMKEEESEIKVILYPNPTKGIVKADINDLPLNASTEARIYDLSGNQKLLMNDIGMSTDIDLSRLPDGIYVLQIRINTKILNWKIIKKE